jgi:hypothetical protein
MGRGIPDFSLVAETVFAGKFQFGVETGCLEGSRRDDVSGYAHGR